MTEFERIVRRARRRQLDWTAQSVDRIDSILRRSALEISAKLKEIAGTGTLQERHLSSLLGEIARSLDGLRDAHSDLMGVHLLGSAQITADREMVLAGRLFSGAELEEMTRGLAPELTRDAFANGVGRVQVGFGYVAEHAVNAIYQRVMSDGLTLSSRLWNLDAETRRAIEDRVVGAVADGTSSRDLARNLRGYLTDVGQGNARYNSMRLARSEIAQAYREGHIQAATTDSGELKSFISAIGWRLSSSHSEPDICCQAGTLIETNTGPKPIEQITLGERVLTHEMRWQSVTRLYRNTIPAGSLIRLHCQSGQSRRRDLVVTPNHRVLTDRGWIPAGDLQRVSRAVGLSSVQSGSQCHSADDTAYVGAVETDGEVVYNLGVAEDNSYLANGIAVHNCDEWASQDIDGLGPGNYLPESVPIDHPNGFCMTLSILTNHQDQQFVTKEPNPGAVASEATE